MATTEKPWPVLFEEQKRRRNRSSTQLGSAGYISKRKLKDRFARHLILQGTPVTHEVIRSMLLELDRGYAVTPQAISAALFRLHDSEELSRWPNGKQVAFGDTTYRSIREAAKAQQVAVETVRRWIKADKEGWCYVQNEPCLSVGGDQTTP